MAKARVCQSKRGPKRDNGSPLKLKCAYKLCKNHNVDVKNASHTLPFQAVDHKKVRLLSKACKTAKFCCADHRSKARAQQASNPIGGREALTPPQVLALFNIMLVDLDCPWAAAAFMLALFLGERCFCALQARDSWFQYMDSDHPTLNIPKVNGKTKAREFPLEKRFADIFMQWARPGSVQGRCVLAAGRAKTAARQRRQKQEGSAAVSRSDAWRTEQAELQQASDH